MLLYMRNKVDRIDWVYLFEDYCPWLQMIPMDRDLSDNKREKVFNKLGITTATATCWVTGKHVAVKHVLILPVSTKINVMRRLQLDADFRTDVDGVPSFMILDDFLEDAYNSLKISFSPVDLLHTNVLRLKIWDSKCRNYPVGLGTPVEMENDINMYGKQLTTIGDYDGFPLNVPESWRVSKRVLAYHTLCCYIYHKYKKSKSIDEDEPADFSSQTAKGRDKIRQQLAEIFRSSIREDGDNDDEDEDDNDVDEDEDDNEVGVGDNVNIFIVVVVAVIHLCSISQLCIRSSYVLCDKICDSYTLMLSLLYKKL